MIYPMDDITDFLYLIGSVFAPIIAIQIADFFLLKKDYSKRDFSFLNLGIWLLGFLFYHILMRIDIIVSNTFPCMVITISIFLQYTLKNEIFYQIFYKQSMNIPMDLLSIAQCFKHFSNYNFI